MSDGTASLEDGRPNEGINLPRKPEAPKPAVGEREKAVGDKISSELGSRGDPDKIARDLASDASKEKDSDYSNRVKDYILDARKRYNGDTESYPSPEVRDVNGQLLELGFSNLRRLEDPNNLDEARLGVGEYADILCLLGAESVWKDSITEDKVESDEGIDVMLETDIISRRSEKLFMATCEKLFPDIKTQVNTGDLKGNLGKVAAMLEHNKLLSHIGKGAEMDAEVIEQADSSQARFTFDYYMDKLGEGMQSAVTQEEDEDSVVSSESSSPGLRPVQENYREDMVNTVKALAILKLSVPKQVLSPAEIAIAKARGTRLKIGGAELASVAKSSVNSETEVIQPTPKQETQAPQDQPQQLENISDSNFEQYHRQGKGVLMNGHSWQVLDVYPDGRVIVSREKTIQELLDGLESLKKTGGSFISGSDELRSVTSLDQLRFGGKWIAQEAIRSPQNSDRQRDVDECRKLQARITSGEFAKNQYGELGILVTALERNAQRLNKEKQDYERISGKR